MTHKVLWEEIDTHNCPVAEDFCRSINYPYPEPWPYSKADRPIIDARNAKADAFLEHHIRACEHCQEWRRQQDDYRESTAEWARQQYEGDF